LRPIPTQRISKKALKIWRITGGLESVLYIAIPFGFYFIKDFFQWPSWIVWILLTFVFIISVIKIIVIPTIRWKRWSYEVHDSEVDLQFGIFIVRRVLIPMIRVQHVDTRQGPLLRKYKLATVTITTAATVHQIPALTEERAAMLRDRISHLAAEADNDL